MLFCTAPCMLTRLGRMNVNSGNMDRVDLEARITAILEHARCQYQVALSLLCPEIDFDLPVRWLHPLGD